MKLIKVFFFKNNVKHRFYKLLISYLSEHFATSKNKEVQNLIDRQFKGICTYRTQCKKCGFCSEKKGTYYELELNVKKNSTLDECLMEYIGEEELSGSN
jgi:ubiquitin C-terminal hydrolase